MRMLVCLFSPLIFAIPISAADTEPVHEGKTLSEWVSLMNRYPGDHSAVQRLGEMGEPAIPSLISAMQDHADGAIRWLCHVALAEIGPAALPELDRMMMEGNARARVQAVLSFEKILGKDAVPRLQAATQDSDGGVRARAHGALLRLGEPSSENLPPMLEILRTGTESERWFAAEALGHTGAKAAGAESGLGKALRDPAAHVTERSLRALEEIGTADAMDHAYRERARRLGDPDRSVEERVKAAHQLGTATGAAEFALPLLREVAAGTAEDVLVRGYAAWAAESIDPWPASNPPRVFHVAREHPNAGDANPGTEAAPWRTIQRASEALKPGDTVLVHAGTYREFVRPFLGGTGPERTITYRAAPGKHPLLKGSDIWTPEWRDEGGGLWSAPYERHPWDHPESWPKPQEGPMHRADQVFCDEVLLIHVGKKEELSEREGTFLTDDAEGRLWVHLPEGTSPDAHTIERSMRQQVFAPAVRGLGYIRVEGLTMRHAAAPESNGSNWHQIGHRAVMSVRSGHHWTIEYNTIEWGNAQGLDLGTEGWGKDLAWQPIVSEERGHHTAGGNRVNSHGVAGIVGWGNGQKHLLLEDNVTNFNCRKGNFYQYEAAGVKFHKAKDCIIRRHRAEGNRAFGIWLDHDCERNRVSECILVDNTAAGLFFEISPGPNLADNNVIMGTRDAVRGNWGDGIYSHDGNHTVCVNNFVRGCDGYGFRFRALFGRSLRGKPTTTSFNRISNNFLFGNGLGAVSLNPESPRAEDNLSDRNIIWQGGTPVVCRLENTDRLVNWEDTAVGRALGRSGPGNLDVPFPLWQELVERDRESLLVPHSLLFPEEDAKTIRESLTRLWGESLPALGEGFSDPTPREALQILRASRPDLAHASPVRTMWLGPSSGVQIWDDGAGLSALRWHGENVGELDPLPARAFVMDPIPWNDGETILAAGDRFTLNLPEPGTVLFSTLDAKAAGRRLSIAAAADTPPGDYAVIVGTGRGWVTVPVRVDQGLAIVGLESIVEETGVAVLVRLKSALRRPVETELLLTLDDVTTPHPVAIEPVTTTVVRVPVDRTASGSGARSGAREVRAAIVYSGTVLEAVEILSFAQAPGAGSWDGVPRYSFDDFPGGAFPPGAAAFALFQGGLSAEWAARHDETGLILRIEVTDDVHVQNRSPENLWEGDSVQLRILPPGETDSLEIDLGLHSGEGKAIAYRRLSPDPGRFPAGTAGDVSVQVTRREKNTIYECVIPWGMLGMNSAPDEPTPLRFSIMVNDSDGGQRHGYQWFRGIHTHRGEVEKMGVLWVAGTRGAG